MPKETKETLEKKIKLQGLITEKAARLYKKAEKQRDKMVSNLRRELAKIEDFVLPEGKALDKAETKLSELKARLEELGGT